jgi:hypothetical protein
MRFSLYISLIQGTFCREDLATDWLHRHSFPCHSRYWGWNCGFSVDDQTNLRGAFNDRAAIGNNLKDRFVALGNKVVLPTDLMDALSNVRLLTGC